MTTRRFALRFAAPLVLVLPLGATNEAGLAAALAEVESHELSADVHFLASDELAGRDSPSLGLRIAARYIQSRVQRLGWQPGAGTGYLHVYELGRQRLDGVRTGLKATRGGDEVALRFGEAYVFPSRSLWNGEVQGGLVYCGAGDEAAFAAGDLSGRWALCIESEGPWNARQKRAKEAGACGLVITGPAGDETHYAERHARWVAASNAESFETRSEPGFHTVYVDRPAVDRILALAGVSGEPALGTAVDVNVRESRATAVAERVKLENVCAFWPGSDPELADEVLLLSAHYDHVGVASDGDAYNGADDNASGTSALLAVAEALARYGPLPRSVMLIWVSAEEKGLLGSQAWTRAPTLPAGTRAVADINVDMVGRNAPDYLLITPSKDHPAYNGLVELAQRLAPEEGFPTLGGCDEYWNRSDHANFHDNLDIPVAFLFSDVHEDYHKPTDTADKIDYDKLRRVSRLLVRMVHELAGDALDPEQDWRPRTR